MSDDAIMQVTERAAAAVRDERFDQIPMGDVAFLSALSVGELRDWLGQIRVEVPSIEDAVKFQTWLRETLKLMWKSKGE